jgi:hypothetical protein
MAWRGHGWMRFPALRLPSFFGEDVLLLFDMARARSRAARMVRHAGRRAPGA